MRDPIAAHDLSARRRMRSVKLAQGGHAPLEAARLAANVRHAGWTRLTREGLVALRSTSPVPAADAGRHGFKWCDCVLRALKGLTVNAGRKLPSGGFLLATCGDMLMATDTLHAVYSLLAMSAERRGSHRRNARSQTRAQGCRLRVPDLQPNWS